MNVESLRRWHWALIGLAVGLMSAWTWTRFNQSGGLEAARTIDSRHFEESLRAPPLRGYPWLKGLRLHQDGARYVLTMKQLQVAPGEKHPENARHYLYVPVRLNGGPPYLPDDVSQTALVTVDPASAWPNTLQINGRPSFASGSLLKLARWRTDAGSSQPGTAAEIGLVLRPADYRMTVFPDPAQRPGSSMKALVITLNGHPIAQLSKVQSSGKEAWRTTVPRDAFANGAWQRFAFNDSSHSIRIKRIQLEDPRYTVLDYLLYARRGNPRLSWGTAWWDDPQLALAVFGAAGLLLIGGIWPFVLQLLIGAGYGRPQPAVEYDLNRFEGESPSNLPTADETNSGMQELLALEKRMEEQLAAATPAPAEPSVAAGNQPARQLSSQPDPAADLAQPVPQSDHEYAGEYYPVARRAK